MNTVLDTGTIQAEVKKYASEIRTRRIDKAKELEDSSVNIAQEKQSIRSLLEQVQDALSKLTVSSQNKETLNRLIIELENAYSQYEYSTRNLARRFQSAKIRVIAFGKKGQGKSSFIQAFTKLPDEIVTPKDFGSTKDKTGTTCIYFHKPGVSAKEPEIYVVFRKPEEILSKVNEALSMLSKAGLSINGKKHFVSLSELQNVLANEHENLSVYNKIKNLTQNTNSTIPEFLSYKNILMDFFYPHSDYSEIIDNSNKDYFTKDKGKRISLSELPMYNDMQYEGARRFPIVSEIRVYVDLGRDNMFENIEICDTKGISVQAGGRAWEKELYSELENCDAAFSIQFDGDPSTGEGPLGFYQKINNEMTEHPGHFNDFGLKHYIIINSHTDAKLEEVIGNAEDIAPLSIAQSLYIGALINNAKIKSGKKDITLNMQGFVDFVIYNMIKNIVVNTNETDKNLENALKGAKKVIDVKTTEIRKLLQDINKGLPEKELNWDDVIINSLFKRKRDVENDIEKYAQSEKIILPTTKAQKDNKMDSPQNANGNMWDDDEEDESYMNDTSNDSNLSEEDISTNEYIPDEREISVGIYNMLTHENLEKNDDISNQQAVELAIGRLFDKNIKIAGNQGIFLKQNIIGTAKYIGSFVDHLSSLIFNEINQNVNHYFISNSDKDNLTEFKNKVFNIIWEGFYVNHFCEFERFDIESLKTLIKSDTQKYPMFKTWVENYETTGDNKATCIYPRTSYAILKAYFDSVSELPSEEELRSNTHTIFKKEELKHAVIAAYMFHDYVTRYKEQINNDISNKRNVLTAIISDMGGEQKYVYELLDLYKSLRPHEYGKILGECGLISSSEKTEFENQENIKIFRSLKEKIDLFNSSL